MSTTPSGRQFPWHAIVVTAITAFFVWWFLKDLNLREVARSILRAHPGYLGAALVVTLQTYVIRAWRWQQLLVPIGRARYRTAFRTTVIGFAATFLLPGRIGEVLRPYLLARQEGFSVPATFATVIVERVLDLAAVLLLFGLAVLTLPMELHRTIEVVALTGAIGSVIVVVAMIVLAGHPERLGRWAERLTSRLPSRLASMTRHLVQTFTEGLAVMRRPRPLVISFLLSLALWVSVALGLYFVSLAFDLAMPFVGSFLVLLILVGGVAVPTPGGAGTFHAAYSYGMTTFFGAGVDAAGAAAIVLHAVSFVPVGLAGLLFMAQDGLTLGGLKGMRSRAEAEEHPRVPVRPDDKLEGRS